VTDESPAAEAPLRKRPYRDSLLANVVLAAILFTFAWLVGSRIGDAIFYAALYLVVATAWNWFRVRKRLAGERE